MTYPVQEAIKQGQTLRLEFLFRGEDLTDAVPRVERSVGLDAGTITVEPDGVDTVIVRSSDTENFALGRHTLELWLDWPPSFDVQNELAIVAFITVSESEGVE